MSLRKHRLAAFLILIFGLALSWFFANRVEVKQDLIDWRRKRELPLAAVNPTIDGRLIDAAILKQKSKKNDDKNLPPEINLAVPFLAQAPFAVWDKLHDEACEEASVIMLDAFLKGTRSISRDEGETAIQNLVEWQKKTFGFFEDTTAEETARILKEYFNYKNVKVSYDISPADIKKELAAGRPVIVPAAGKLLGNPYFRGAGPDYHMLIIKGYTKDGRFIVNDPGTRRGADFTYKLEILDKAIHDWRPDGEILKGRKVMITVE